MTGTDQETIKIRRICRYILSSSRTQRDKLCRLLLSVIMALKRSCLQRFALPI